MKKRIVFLTGTRADFGKLKSLMAKVRDDEAFDLHVFVTGMHMLSKYGYTCDEVERANFRNVYKYMNQSANDRMDHVLAKTISGLSDYIQEIRPDLLVIHGDRVEALAGAAVGALNNVPVGHVEGGEVSGTVDESIRHAVSKLAHIHFVANENARQRLLQLGEPSGSIHVIGSPDIDIANSATLPSLADAKKRYGLTFDPYAIVLFHPVTSELDHLRAQAQVFVDALIASDMNYVVIYPNNDHGSDIIFQEYSRLAANPRFRTYPSIRFEYFLTLMKNARFIVGNSSAGIREAPFFGLPSINVGTRQKNRGNGSTILNVDFKRDAILSAITASQGVSRSASSPFGEGNSAEAFHTLLKTPSFWERPTQKIFVDLPVLA